MPSPFPGMDPYLEHPEFFPEVHHGLIFCMKEAIQGSLPDPYYATTNSRVWIEFSERHVEPDVNVNRGDGPSRLSTATLVAEAGISVAGVVVPVAQDETSEEFLEIRTVQGDQQLVTSIEVLSRCNKTPGAHGRGVYQQKQREMLSSRVNLVEIDLLRGGTHTTAVRRPQAVAAAGEFDYHICVHTFGDQLEARVHAIRLASRLPRILIPLLPGDPGVVIDLQPLFDRCYDSGPYRHRSPYRAHTPEPPLTPEQAAWAEQLLRDKGLLP